MIITDKLPQEAENVFTINLSTVIKSLPAFLPWNLNFWIAGKIARFGVTTESLTFLVELKEEPSIEMRKYFEDLFSPWPATVIEDWKNQKYQAIRLYNEGRLIVDKETMEYIEVPTKVYEAPILTIAEFKKMLPKEIQYKQKLYLTGGLVRNGFSANDIDFIAFDVENRTELAKMSKYFTDLFGWKTDVGNGVMKEREPVYVFLLYEDGKLQL